MGQLGYEASLIDEGSELGTVTPQYGESPGCRRNNAQRMRIMRIRRIEHVQLAMPAGQESQARAFYEGLLGLPEATKPPHAAARGGCWFETDSVKVHLGVEADFRPARKAHPALLVEGLSELKLRLVEAGLSLREDEPLSGYERFYVDDPFGNQIELMEPTHQN